MTSCSRPAGLAFLATGAFLLVFALPVGTGGQDVDVQAQAAVVLTVEGEVLDDATGLPVADVVVLLPKLGVARLSDEFGYFAFEAVPQGIYGITAYHLGYVAFEAEAPVLPGEVLVLRLSPSPIPLPGVDVEARSEEQLTAWRSGRSSDVISRQDVAEAGERTNQLLEVMRTKAPPRLQIRQRGGQGGVTFCIQSSRRAPSVQELRDLGTGCRPALVAMDGVVVYAPPLVAEMAAIGAGSLPEDVAHMVLRQNPDEIESIRILSPTEAFFRYGDSGRLGAVEITTRDPRRPRQPPPQDG